jgi:DNA-binding transcriptional LysR family regulator
VFPRVDVRLLQAVFVLAQELNFTRAAHRLHITQSALSKQISKQINEIQEQHRSPLFTRKNKKNLELTEVGRDQGWFSAILAIHLPMYPKLRVQLISQFSIELSRSVMAGEPNLALVTAPPENSQITAAAFLQTPLYAALLQTRATAQKEHIALQDLAKDDWILFARRVHPVVHASIMDAVRLEGICPKDEHDIITVQQAVHLVSEHVCAAILTKPVSATYNGIGAILESVRRASGHAWTFR